MTRLRSLHLLLKSVPLPSGARCTMLVRGAGIFPIDVMADLNAVPASEEDWRLADWLPGDPVPPGTGALHLRLIALRLCLDMPAVERTSLLWRCRGWSIVSVDFDRTPSRTPERLLLET